MNKVDLLVVGAGPAGMASAVAARRHGLEVLVIDEQPAPGGQIWRSVEFTGRRDDILGPSYVEGRAVAQAFRASGAAYKANAQLWQIEPGFRAHVSIGGCARTVEAEAVILATGAQERPVPFPGWTLPGVLTVGAAQILLKTSGQIPSAPVWIAGSGPLPLLYAAQLLRAGGRIAGYLDTTPAGQWRVAARHLPAALRGAGDLLKGLGWTATLRRNDGLFVSAATNIAAVGDGRLQRLQYRDRQGIAHTTDADLLLVHEGVVPSIHAPLSLGCEMIWDDAQQCFKPALDRWGETSRPRLFVAGDGAGIAGARAAISRGELAATRIAVQLGRIAHDEATTIARPVFRKLGRDLAARPFLDAYFKPRREIFEPEDAAVACRCEELTAGDIRSAARDVRRGPNQVKAATRAGMGPCQGRQCGYTIMHLIAATQDRSPAEVGYFHIRPPLKPVTLGEIAVLDGLNYEDNGSTAREIAP